MFNIYLTYNGDYNSYVKWATSFSFNDEILRDRGLVLICSFDNEPVDGEMKDYVCKWMVSGQRPDPEELKNAIDQKIREYLKTNEGVKEFSLVKIKIG